MYESVGGNGSRKERVRKERDRDSRSESRSVSRSRSPYEKRSPSKKDKVQFYDCPITIVLSYNSMRIEYT